MANKFDLDDHFLSEWDNVKDGTFTNINAASYNFFVFEKAEQYFPLQIVSAVVFVLLVSLSGWLYLLYEPQTPKRLFELDSHLLEMAYDNACHGDVKQNSMISNKHVGAERNINNIFNTIKSDDLKAVGYYRISTSDYVESLLMRLQQETDNLLNSNPVSVTSTVDYGPYLTSTASSEQELLPVRPPAKIYPLVLQVPTPSVSLPDLMPTVLPFKNESTLRTPLYLSLTGGGLTSFSVFKSNNVAAQLRNAHTSNLRGYHYGLQARKIIGRSAFLKFGIDQQHYFQDVEMTVERLFDEKPHAEVSWRYATPEHQEINEIHGDTTIAGMEIRRFVQHNKYSSTQVSMGWGYTLGNDKWQYRPAFSMGMGVLDDASGWTLGENLELIEYGVVDDLFQRIQLFSVAGLEVERKIGEYVGFHLGYQYRQQWSNATSEKDLSFRPGFHYLSAGIQIKL